MSVHMDYTYEYKEIPYAIVFNKEDVDKFYKSRPEIYEPEEGETIFIIARHGENESNVLRKYDGRELNKPLTEKGFTQGQKAGKKLSNRVNHIDHVVFNRMQRTYQTAVEMLKAFPESQREWTEDEGFLERYVGRFEGRELIELEPTNKQDKEVSASGIPFVDKMMFSPDENDETIPPDEKIESYAAIWKRAHQSLQQTAAEQKGKIVLVVTHSGTIRSIYWHLTHELGFFVPYENFKPDNGAYMVVSAKEGKLTLLETDDINIIPPKE